MKTQIYWTVYTTTETGADYKVKGFGRNGEESRQAAVKWESENRDNYPRPLWVQKVEL